MNATAVNAAVETMDNLLAVAPGTVRTYKFEGSFGIRMDLPTDHFLLATDTFEQEHLPQGDHVTVSLIAQYDDAEHGMWQETVGTVYDGPHDMDALRAAVSTYLADGTYQPA